MAQTTTTTIAVLILAKYIENQVRKALRGALILPRMVRQKDMKGTGSLVWSVPKWPTLTAAGVAEGAALVPGAVTPTANDITVSEVGIAVELTQLSKEAGIAADPSDYVEQCTIAVKHKMESDIGALFSGFSVSAGSTGTSLTLDYLIKAMELSDTANDVEDPRVIVLHPRQVGDYRRAIAGTSGATASFYATGLVDPLIKQIPGFVGDFLGVPIFQSPYVPKINADVDYAGVLMSINAIGMGILRDIMVDPQHENLARSDVFAVSSAYGVAELDDAKGVRIVSKVAA